MSERRSARRAGVGWAIAVVPFVLIPSLVAASGRGPYDLPARDEAIPAFARQYRTACSTCHTAAPKLNVLGEVFRLNGYRMPDNQLLLRHDRPVGLGDEAWKDEWPRAIWPGEIPGEVPLALRIQSDAQFTRSESATADFTYRFPHEVYLLGGATLGEAIAAFLEVEWSREGGLEVVQAKLSFANPIPGLPHGLANVWLGQQNPYLFAWADRQIDRAGRQPFRWQTFSPSQIALADPNTGASVASENGFRLALTQPTVELNGVVDGRLYYGVGLGQGAGDLTSDNNGRKDLYYKLRYKFGGLSLDGRYAPGSGPVLGTGGQLLDRSVIVEHFGYFGGEPNGAGTDDSHRSFGIAVRMLNGPWDVGAGWVHSRYDAPWGAAAPGELSVSSVFGKAEYLAFPWLIGSVKVESFLTDIPAAAQTIGFTDGDQDEVRVIPGLVLLVRQNVRGVVEVEWYGRHRPSTEQTQRRPHNLWLRMDVAF